MTKAALCVHCSDIVAPYRGWQANRAWRWCECEHTGVRWRDGTRGLLEVTSLHGPDEVRVLGLNNLFLENAVRFGPAMAQDWRELHDACAKHVEPHYLFHETNRACWALVVRVGESGDVTFVPYGDTPGAKGELAPRPPEATGVGSLS